MSIATRTGDAGMTGLMYNRRVSKCHPRVAAYGAVDELNAGLGMARASAGHDFVRDHVLTVQKELVILMGELATLYVKERGLEGAPLTVIKCEGWQRGMYYEEAGLPWVLR